MKPRQRKARNYKPKFDNKREISKKSQEILDDLCEAAKGWGWTEDQGAGPMVARDKKSYEDSVDAMKKRILYLENRNRQLYQKSK